ncbi:hypothetical protein ASD37_09520 [Mycobacterium sp. Root135]|uniref:hypothetical protein n=1 Tax=Mycobacterium sp. Root135 TaxID=1736457 RepID=UPI0006FC3905|nr:hypothetical protein [Mycobacterium sp. Root135]KQY08166.1 hypothetical protein ASD37_09520 [Mycobacterium sp. Root135]
MPTKLAAAFLAAGVISTGALVAPDKVPLPVVSADVANASVITDALYRLGDVVNGAAYGYAITQDAGSSLPFDVATAFTIAAQNPTLAPSLLSWLVNRYANPSYDYGYPSESGYFTYPTYFREYSLEVIAGALPFPLGPAGANPGLINSAANAIGQAVGGFLSGVLPNPAGGLAATDAFWATDIGKTIVAANLAVTAPVWAFYSTAFYLGYLPADLEATFESAIQNPTEIPGLLSNLVYDLVASDGLLGSLIQDLSAPLRALPGPIGVLAQNVVASLNAGIDNLLSVLPAPIEPTPFPSATSNVNRVADTSAERQVTSIPDPSITMDNVVTLNTPVKLDNPVAPSSDSPPPNAGGTTTGLVKTNDSGPQLNVVRDSVKVTPGDTFAGVTTGTGTGTGTETESATTVDETVSGATTASPAAANDPSDAAAGENVSPSSGAGDPGAAA